MINRVERVDDLVKIRNCIISVADKTGLSDFVLELVTICPEIRIFSTGGTFNALREALGGNHGKNLIQVSDYTGQPEMQGGLVKTLDFKIYLGLLSEPYNDAHASDILRTGGVLFDMVVGNLYPFGEAIIKEGAGIEDARAHIDIGGPCMLRASAKNFLRVASLCDVKDYSVIIEELRKNDGALSLSTRLTLAKKTFAHTAEYDRDIADYLVRQNEEVLKKNYTTA